MSAKNGVKTGNGRYQHGTGAFTDLIAEPVPHLPIGFFHRLTPVTCRLITGVFCYHPSQHKPMGWQWDADVASKEPELSPMLGEMGPAIAYDLARKKPRPVPETVQRIKVVSGGIAPLEAPPIPGREPSLNEHVTYVNGVIIH